MVVVDVETTGLSPARHGIISIGAVEFEKPANQFYGECQVEKHIEIDRAALEVNGFTIEEITKTDRPLPKILAKDFYEWLKPIKDKTLGGHNTGFDAGMLRVAFGSARLKWPFGFRLIDMHALAYGHMKSRGHTIPLIHDTSAISANTVHEYVGLPREPEPHNALVGAKMEAEAMSRLLHGKSLLPEFRKYPLPPKF